MNKISPENLKTETYERWLELLRIILKNTVQKNWKNIHTA